MSSWWWGNAFLALMILIGLITVIQEFHRRDRAGEFVLAVTCLLVLTGLWVWVLLSPDWVRGGP